MTAGLMSCVDAKQAPARKARYPYRGQDAEARGWGGEASAPASNGWRVYVAPRVSSEGLTSRLAGSVHQGSERKQTAVQVGRALATEIRESDK